MNNKRKQAKRLRHERNKRRADKYIEYLNSEQFKIDLHNGMKKIIDNQKENL